MLNSDNISYVEISHKDEIVKVTDKEKIKEIVNSLNKDNDRDSEIEEVKGWVYKISTYDKNERNII